MTGDGLEAIREQGRRNGAAEKPWPSEDVDRLAAILAEPALRHAREAAAEAGRQGRAS